MSIFQPDNPQPPRAITLEMLEKAMQKIREMPYQPARCMACLLPIEMHHPHCPIKRLEEAAANRPPREEE